VSHIERRLFIHSSKECHGIVIVWKWRAGPLQWEAEKKQAATWRPFFWANQITSRGNVFSRSVVSFANWAKQIASRRAFGDQSGDFRFLFNSLFSGLLCQA
jgi:hypothetical protein